jgi:hypothetical protein
MLDPATCPDSNPEASTDWHLPPSANGGIGESAGGVGLLLAEDVVDEERWDAFEEHCS